MAIEGTARFLCEQDTLTLRIRSPGLHEGLVLHIQGIGDPVDVVEIADDLGGVVDGRIFEATVPQSSNLRLANTGRIPSQLLGKHAQTAVLRRQLRRMPVPGDRVHEVIGLVVIEPVLLLDLGTEVVCMRANSVDTVVGG